MVNNPQVADTAALVAVDTTTGCSPETFDRHGIFLHVRFDKYRHTPIACWYRFDDSYTTSSSTSAPRATHASTNNQFGDWYLDTGANTRVTSNYSQLQSPHPYTSTNTLTLGNGQSLPITHTGSSFVHILNGKYQLFSLHYVPTITSICYLSIILPKITTAPLFLLPMNF